MYILSRCYDKCMLGKVLAISTLCSFAILSAVMQTTSPSSIHPVGILFVFILLYLLALGVLTFFVYGVSSIVFKSSKQLKREQSLSLKQSYIYGSVLALAPVMLVGMASIGRLGFYQVLLVVAFECAVCFYVSKRR